MMVIMSIIAVMFRKLISGSPRVLPDVLAELRLYVAMPAGFCGAGGASLSGLAAGGDSLPSCYLATPKFTSGKSSSPCRSVRGRRPLR